MAMNTSSLNDSDELTKGVTSLSDYRPNKLDLFLLQPSTTTDTRMPPQDLSPLRSEDSPGLNSRSYSFKPPKISKKKRFIRNFPLNSADYSSSSVFHYRRPQIPDECDMRFLIIRHGERVDRFFGPNWYMFAFDQHNQYRPFHPNLPARVPFRSNKHLWALDTPLTRSGLDGAQNVGRVLGLNHFEPTYVYSSPAMRCMLTAIEIIRGLGMENRLTIRIEPGLLELGAARFGLHIFHKPIDWHKAGINVDLAYRPILTTIPLMESEEAYYLRSKYVIRAIEQLHSHNLSQDQLNILLVGHATSPETLTWDLVGRRPNTRDLLPLSLNIGYLQMVIAERTRQLKQWSLKHIPLQATTLKWV